jgi:hypothetical protein
MSDWKVGGRLRREERGGEAEKREGEKKGVAR